MNDLFYQSCLVVPFYFVLKSGDVNLVGCGVVLFVSADVVVSVMQYRYGERHGIVGQVDFRTYIPQFEHGVLHEVFCSVVAIGEFQRMTEQIATHWDYYVVEFLYFHVCYALYTYENEKRDIECSFF